MSRAWRCVALTRCPHRPGDGAVDGLGLLSFASKVPSIFFSEYSSWALYILEHIPAKSKLHSTLYLSRDSLSGSSECGDVAEERPREAATGADARRCEPPGVAQCEEQHVVEAERERGRSAKSDAPYRYLYATRPRTARLATGSRTTRPRTNWLLDSPSSLEILYSSGESC